MSHIFILTVRIDCNTTRLGPLRFMWSVNVIGQYNWTVPNSWHSLFQKISEFSHDGFLQSYKQAATPFRCTNISDIFHSTALRFCFCVAAAENLSQDWRDELPTQLTKWLQFCIVLYCIVLYCIVHNKCIFFPVQLTLLQLSTNNSKQ
jgi:hypothetical protein